MALLAGPGVAGVRDAGPAAEPPVTAEVRNASGRAGLARQVTRLLREQGVDVVYFGNATPEVDSTRVLVRRGDPGRGETVAKALGTGRVSAAPDPKLRVDVTVLLGRDYRLPRGRMPL